MLRFHLDESVALAVAIGLKRRGIEVTTAATTGLLSAIDEKHLKFAHGQNSVLVTHDFDFLVLATTGIPHAGIVYCHPQKRSIGQIIAGLELLSDCLEPAQMVARVEFL